MVQWLFFCATKDNWPRVINDSAITQKIKSWEKAVTLMHISSPEVAIRVTEAKSDTTKLIKTIAQLIDKTDSANNKRQGWKKLPDNIKRLYINASYDRTNI